MMSISWLDRALREGAEPELEKSDCGPRPEDRGQKTEIQRHRGTRPQSSVFWSTLRVIVDECGVKNEGQRWTHGLHKSVYGLIWAVKRKKTFEIEFRQGPSG